MKKVRIIPATPTQNKEPFEIKIESRSGIFVVFWKTEQGAFEYISDFNVECNFTDPKDIYWNTYDCFNKIFRTSLQGENLPDKIDNRQN